MSRSIPRHHLALLAGLGLLAAACGSSGGDEAAPPPIPRPEGDLLTGGNFAPFDATLWHFTTGGDATAEPGSHPDFDGTCLVVGGADLGAEPYATQLVYWDDEASAPKFLDLSPGTYRIHARVRASGPGRSVQIVLQDATYWDVKELTFAPTATAGNYQSDAFVLESSARVSFKVNLGGIDNRETTFQIDDLYLDRESQTAVAPVFAPRSGTAHETLNVTLTTPTSAARIFYTITNDGTEPAEPTSASTEYTGPITLEQPPVEGDSTVYRIKAVAAAPGMTNSQVVSAQYTVNNGALIPVSEDFEDEAIGFEFGELAWGAADIVADVVDDPLAPGIGNNVLRVTQLNYNAAPVITIEIPAGKTLADYNSFTFKGHFASGDVGWKHVRVYAYGIAPTGQFARTEDYLGDYSRARGASTAWENITVDISSNTSSLTGTVYYAFGINGDDSVWYADDVTLVE